jgi:quinol monooxygenase YgiN
MRCHAALSHCEQRGGEAVSAMRRHSRPGSICRLRHCNDTLNNPPVKEDRTMPPAELFIFARFHAREGQQEAVAGALQTVIAPTRQEPGCLAINAFRSVRDPRLFYIHSRWVDEAAFETHATLRHTITFIDRVQVLIDHPLDITRTRALGL